MVRAAAEVVLRVQLQVVQAHPDKVMQVVILRAGTMVKAVVVLVQSDILPVQVLESIVL